jgi:hypothetical protein
VAQLRPNTPFAPLTTVSGSSPGGMPHVIVGTNLLDEWSTIGGVGPITIDAQAQDSGVGTLLMLDVIERAGCTGVAAAMLGPVDVWVATTSGPTRASPG